MNELRLSPPLSFAAPSQDLFKEFRAGPMPDVAAAAADDEGVIESRDAAGLPAPKLKSSSSSSSGSSASAPKGPVLQTYLAYCADFLDLGQYPKLAEQDRAVIADFLSGELLQSVQWKHLFPQGAFECILNTCTGPETDDYACTEYTVFKINFDSVSCSKDIRRVWTAKGRAKVLDEVADDTAAAAAPDIAERHDSLELQSPLKHPTSKRRTPTRRRSFEERDRRRSGSRGGSSLSTSFELPPAKKIAKPKTPRKTPTPNPKPTTTTPVKKMPKKKAAATPVMVPSEETYAVLTILDVKKAGVRYMYLVRWAGTDAAGKPWPDSWEPAAHISDDLLRDFWLRQGRAKPAPAAARKVSAHYLLDADPPAA